MNAPTTTAIDIKNNDPIVLRQDYSVFHILGQEIGLISEQLETCRNTAAIIDDQIYYLGPEPATIGTAIIAYEQAHNRSLTDTELQQVIKDHSTT